VSLDRSLLIVVQRPSEDTQREIAEAWGGSDDEVDKEEEDDDNSDDSDGDNTVL
jgi:hypothetical protein